MENSNYSSLTDKLIQNGILSSNQNANINIFEKYYDIEPSEDYSNSPFAVKETEVKPVKKNSSTRINEYDMDLIKGKITNQTIKKPFNNIYDFILIKFFPKFYKAGLIKKAMKKMSDLNIDTNALFNKTIPYGENEIHYNELIKYLNCANELQSELNKND